MGDYIRASCDDEIALELRQFDSCAGCDRGIDRFGYETLLFLPSDITSNSESESHPLVIHHHFEAKPSKSSRQSDMEQNLQGSKLLEMICSIELHRYIALPKFVDIREMLNPFSQFKVR